MSFRDVIGIANLLVDVNQSQKLAQARNQLNQIEMGILQENIRKQILEALRNHVFDASKKTNQLSNFVTKHPLQVYVAVSAIQWRLTDLGINAEIFPEFKDKEFVDDLENNLSSMISNAKSKLSESEIEDAELPLGHIKDMPLLELAIEDQELREEYRDINEALKSKKNRTWISLLLIFIVPILALIIDLSMELPPFISNVFGISGMCVAPVLGIIMFLTRKPKETQELKQNKQYVSDQFLDKNELNEIKRRFGVQTKGGFYKILDEKTTEVNEFMSILPLDVSSEGEGLLLEDEITESGNNADKSPERGKFCPECGGNIIAEDRFCSNCGAGLS